MSPVNGNRGDTLPEADRRTLSAVVPLGLIFSFLVLSQVAAETPRWTLALSMTVTMQLSAL